MFKNGTETNSTLKRVRPLSSTDNDPYTVMQPKVFAQIFREEGSDVFIIEVDIDADTIDGGAFEFRARSYSEYENNGQMPTPEFMLELVNTSFSQMNEDFHRQAKMLGFEYDENDPILFMGPEAPVDEDSMIEKLKSEIKKAYGL
jgi:hypothetical protein